MGGVIFFGTVEVWPYLWHVQFPLTRFLITANSLEYYVILTTSITLIWQYFIACLLAYYSKFLFSKTKLSAVLFCLLFAVLSVVDLSLGLEFSNIGGGGNSTLDKFITSLTGALFVYMVLLSVVAFAVLVVKFIQQIDTVKFNK